jgi:hypothetical protein
MPSSTAWTPSLPNAPPPMSTFPVTTARIAPRPGPKARLIFGSTIPSAQRTINADGRSGSIRIKVFPARALCLVTDLLGDDRRSSSRTACPSLETEVATARGWAGSGPSSAIPPALRGPGRCPDVCTGQRRQRRSSIRRSPRDTARGAGSLTVSGHGCWRRRRSDPRSDVDRFLRTRATRGRIGPKDPTTRKGRSCRA